MTFRRPSIPELFVHRFEVDLSAPFRRHLNRLEVEIGKEDYRHLKKVELLEEMPSAEEFARMEDITSLLLETTQNNYNRNLLRRLGVRIYIDISRYAVYYRLPDRALRFSAAWRQRVLEKFFSTVPLQEEGWRLASPAMPGFECRFLPDRCGGVLLLRKMGQSRSDEPLLTATHGPYDPWTLDVALYFLRMGKGGAALINLGFSGREPLTDENLEKLKRWGVPLNPSNIDVIYPYTDLDGHPHCYKLEEGLRRFVAEMEIPAPGLIVDIHGCVGTESQDRRVVIGLGGRPPYPRLDDLGHAEERGEEILLRPAPALQQGLSFLRPLSEEVFLQFCEGPGRCYHFRVERDLRGRAVDPRTEVASLLPGEERTYLCAENIRWLPGARGNSLQRKEALRMRKDALCLHVEIPTEIRRRIALELKKMEIADSLDSSSL